MAAKTKTKKATVKVEKQEVRMTPKALAENLGISPKNLRGFLRQQFPRVTEEKNTSWTLSPEMVEAATAKFTASPVEDEVEA